MAPTTVSINTVVAEGYFQGQRLRTLEKNVWSTLLAPDDVTVIVVVAGKLPKLLIEDLLNTSVIYVDSAFAEARKSEPP